MQIKTTETTEIKINDLAECLANGTPEEFAEFWRVISNKGDMNKDEKASSLAIAMLPSLGSVGKSFFKKVYMFLEYYEMEAKRNGDTYMSGEYDPIQKGIHDD